MSEAVEAEHEIEEQTAQHPITGGAKP
jgi:hypothetical protein